MCPAYGVDEYKTLCKNGKLPEALKAARSLLSSGLEVRPQVIRIIAQTCLHKEDLECSRFLLGLIATYSLDVDPILGCQLIRMFVSYNSLPEANQTFCCLAKPNKFTWSAIIHANATLGQGEKAIELYHRMLNVGLEPDGHIFVAALKGCANARALSEGRHIEITIKGSACKCSPIVANAIIDMYVRCDSLEDAERAFSKSSKRDVISWNTLILGYASHGQNEKAFVIFSEMESKGLRPDPATFISILKACDGPKYLVNGNIVYAFIMEEGVELDERVGNKLIHMYALCGSLEDACKVFDYLPKIVVATYNAMMSGYLEQNQPLEAILVFQLMQQMEMQPNCVTFLCVIRACTEIGSIDLGRLIHLFISDTSADNDVNISNALIDMYNKCGDIWAAQFVFSKRPERVVVTWNTVISSLIQHGQAHVAFEYFCEMLQRKIQPDSATFVSVLSACLPDVAGVSSGFEIHAFVVFAGLEGESIVGNSLIDMHSRYGNLKDAHNVFDRLSKRDVVSWNTLMTGYAWHRDKEKTSALFLQMHLEGGEPDRTTFICVLKSFSDPLSIDYLNILFHLIAASGFENDPILRTSVFNLYVKCGNLKNASWVSCGYSNRDLVTWNAVIAEHAQRGNSRTVQEIFKYMQNEGVEPDDATFLSLFATVGHAGSLTQGNVLYQLMQHEYGLNPQLDHFNCLVDLLGRAGHVKEAEDLLQVMPFAPDIVSWTCLLEHSRTHDSLEVGRRSYNNFMNLDTEDASGYVLIWQIVAQYWLNNDPKNVQDIGQVDALIGAKVEC